MYLVFQEAVQVVEFPQKRKISGSVIFPHGYPLGNLVWLLLERKKFTKPSKLLSNCCDQSGLDITLTGIEFLNHGVSKKKYFLLDAKHWIYIVTGLHISLTCLLSKYSYITRSFSNFCSFTPSEKEYIQKCAFDINYFSFKARMEFYKQVDENDDKHWARRRSEGNLFEDSISALKYLSYLVHHVQY